MEAYKDGLKGYWKVRGYHRIDGAVGGRLRPNRAELGREGEGRRRRRFWRIKIVPRLRVFRKLSPRRFLTRIRDAYVGMMLSLASAPGFGSGAVGYGGGVPGAVHSGFGKPTIKEYDEKVLVEIYKSLVAAAAAAGSGGSDAGRATMVAVRR